MLLLGNTAKQYNILIKHSKFKRAKLGTTLGSGSGQAQDQARLRARPGSGLGQAQG